MPDWLLLLQLPPQFLNVFSFQLREFDTRHEDTCSWLTDVQHQVDSLSSQPAAADRLHSAQVSRRLQLQGETFLNVQVCVP